MSLLLHEFDVLKKEVKAMSGWKRSFFEEVKDTYLDNRDAVSTLKETVEEFKRSGVSIGAFLSGHERRLSDLESEAGRMVQQVVNIVISINELKEGIGLRSPRGSGPLKSSTGTFLEEERRPIDGKAVKEIKG